MTMGRPQVSIRLGTAGRGDVEKDFVAIGDASAAQAQRYQATWEKASAAVDSALERQAKAATRLASVSSSPIQNQINAATGVSAGGGNAKAAAAALAAELERAESEARQLIAAIDPLFAAQARYENQIARINAVRATGQLDEQRYQQLLAHERVLLDEATAAGTRNTNSRGAMRMGMQQLSFQIGDVSQQIALGTKYSTIFAQQSGQVVQALQIMGGQGNAFLRFLGGPWGIALSSAAVVLTPLISKLIESGTAIDSQVDKLKKDADQAKVTADAQKVFGDTLDGVTDALRRNAEALGKMDDAGKSAARQALEVALAEQMKLKAIEASTLATLKGSEAALKNAQAVNFGAGGGASAYAAQSFYQAQVDAAHAAVEQAAKDAIEADRQVADATSRMAVEVATRDPVERIKKHYADLIEATRKRLLVEKATTEEILKQTRALQDQSDAAVKAEQAKDKKGPANAGGTAIFNEQIAAFFDTAAKYRGRSEHNAADRGVLEAFFKEANQNLDPEKVKWCAAFVNAVLAANGVKGTGSLAAKSFLTFGKDDTHSPQRGDIAIVRSGAGDHVGFVDSVDKAGNVRMLAGNTGDKVAEATYSKSQVLGIRRPPTPSEAATAADKAATEALTAEGNFNSELEKLNQQYLAAQQKLNAGADAQASVQLARVQSEHDAEAKEIETNLAAGKYGEATSQLAQARAKQLQAANDAAAKEKDAAIRLQYSVDSLKQQDVANEREAQFRMEGLQFQESIARTADERRRVQLDIIDSEYKEKELHLKYLIALDTLLGKTQDAADAAAQLAHLPTEHQHEIDKLRFDDLNAALNEVDQTGQRLLDDLLNPDNWTSWGDMGKRVLHEIEQELITMALLNPLKNMLFGSNLPTIAGAFAGLLGGGIPAPNLGGTVPVDLGIGGPGTLSTGPVVLPGMYATGTEYAPGGLAWVGEHGRELVRLPRGSKVYNASASQRRAANDGGIGAINIPIAIDATGADAAALGRLQQELVQLKAELPARIMAAYYDGVSRNFIRAK